MYKTCMFCTRPLKTNEVVEEFPIGRRLAFDAAKGRLWVVCRSCERWNLTPLEERWEAVETCEKLFRGTRIRTSSENIGLAKHPEGLELVRIGRPLRPEFAAWRYGDQFGKRRRRSIVRWTAAGVALAGGVALGGAVGGLSGAVLGLQSVNYVNFWNTFRPSAYFRPADGRLRWMNGISIAKARLGPSDDSDDLYLEATARHVMTRKNERFEGEDALRALNAILPRVNAMGGTSKTVKSAVSEIESSGHPHRFVRELIKQKQYSWSSPGVQMLGISRPAKLALEMALHEEQERRALEGELWRLEQAWRDAEEIAAISDSLLLPKGTARFLSRHSSHDEGA